MTQQHERWMGVALEEAELARGTTGNNPWVGCVIVSPQGEVVGRGHTLGPGEDHAEVAAARHAQARGYAVVGATLYSTLEPCSFHGRTPACSRAIAERGIASVVIGMRDPHPRVDGEGVRILREAGVEVIEGVCETEVRRQLGLWVFEQHPGDALRRTQGLSRPERVVRLTELYGVDRLRIEALLAGARMKIQLVRPTERYRDSFFLRLREFQHEGLPWWVGGDLETVAQDFAAFVAKKLAASNPSTATFVPTTHLWGVTEEEFVGRISIRHELNDALRIEGGHIGYDTVPSFRGRGVATEMLRQALPVARALGLTAVLLTCDETNAASIRVIERNGGSLRETKVLGANRPLKRYYWITLS